ncbi:MAG: response regulator transcription factor [Actinobacteria bacterium]|nr:response regulator transcription factor [Actinomycetota bacterium]
MAEGRILIVEDEKNIASLVTLYLENEGFRVNHVTDGSKALDAVRRFEPDLVVLDVMLPGMDGTEICRRLRAEGDIPIIMLTARDQEVDKVVGLELGADDYVTKPFSPRELVARVKAVLRRTSECSGKTEKFSLGVLSLDVDRRQVTVDGSPVELTAREFDLLAFLVRNRGIVFSRDRLMERVWEYDHPVDSRTVDSHVKSLRQKLGSAADLIKTVRGVGYKADI